MSQLIRPTPWTRQPGLGVPVNTALLNPWVCFNFTHRKPRNIGLKQHLQLAEHENSYLINSETTALGMAMRPSPTNSGADEGFLVGSAGSLAGISPANSPFWGCCAFIHAQRVDMGSSINVIVSYTQGSVAGGDNGTYLKINASNQLSTIFFAGGFIQWSTALVVGQAYKVVWARNALGNTFLWVNGQLVGTGSGSTNSDSAATNTLYINTDNSNRTYRGAISLVAMGPEDITTGLGQKLSENPWQLFAPINRMWFPSVTSSGTLYTQSAAGVITFTGGYTSAYIANRSVSGSVTSVGNLARTTNKTFAGTTVAVGSIVKSTNKNVGGTVTGVGSVLKNTARRLTSSITPSGVLATLFATSRSVAGAFTMAATLATQLYNAVVSGVASRFYTLRRFLGRR